MKKWWKLAAVLGVLSMILGCTKRELEDRYFPLAMEVHHEDGKYRVEYALPNMGEETGQKKSGQEKSAQEEKDTKEEDASGKTLEEACRVFQGYVDKFIDVGHLKAIILGEEILEDQDLLKKTLSYFEENTVFGRNTMVFAYKEEEGESLITKTASSTDSLGTYLENLIKNNPYREENGETTLGNLLDFWHNRLDETSVPLLKIQNGNPIKEKDYAVKSIVKAAAAVQSKKVKKID